MNGGRDDLREAAVLFSNRGRWGDDAPPNALRFVATDRIVGACALVRRGSVVDCASRDGDGSGPAPRLVAAAPLRAPIAARGVLLDVVRTAGGSWLADDSALEPAHLDECAERQGVTIESGDALLVRTGMLARCASQGEWRAYREGPAPGLSPSCARWLYEREVALVAADTAFVERRRPGEPGGALRHVALEHTGVVFGESFALDALGQSCAADGDYAFLFVCPPPDPSGCVQPFAVK